jgi:3-oxoadipate enol-lactonase
VTAAQAGDRWLPALLPGGPLDLPGRGETFIRLRRPAAGEPTVLLLHGIGVTADVNWFTSYSSLAEHGGVVAIDHRGHGRGIRPDRPVRLADCADDAIAALDVLGIDRAIVVGYSMGGPIAQLAWHRHRDRVAGLVLCATAHRFRGIEPVRDLAPSIVLRLRASAQARTKRSRLDRDLRRWIASEVAHTDRRCVVQAGFSLARFDSSAWIGDVDVPHAVVVTTRDAAVVPARQRRLVAALPDPTVVEAPVDHAGCVTRPRRFVPALLDALSTVTERGAYGAHEPPSEAEAGARGLGTGGPAI